MYLPDAILAISTEAVDSFQIVYTLAAQRSEIERNEAPKLPSASPRG